MRTLGVEGNRHRNDPLFSQTHCIGRRHTLFGASFVWVVTCLGYSLKTADSCGGQISIRLAVIGVNAMTREFMPEKAFHIM